MRLGVLVSGRGSNLEAVLEAVADRRLAHVEPVIVISNRDAVRALAIAGQYAVATAVVERAAFPDRAARDEAIGRALAEAGVDLVLLAGYDEVLRPSYFAAFAGRTINIHPSLLPRHGGVGMIGLAVHQAVLAAGDDTSGVTIHEVTPALDAGQPLRQVQVAVLPGDTPQTLAERVLAAEHLAVVEVLSHLSASMTGAPRT